MKQKLLAFLLVILSLLPQLVMAQEFSVYEVGRIIFGPDAEPEWFEPYNFLQKLFFPFIALWMVMTGIMFELRIFRAKQGINYIVAFMIAMIACPTGWMVWWVKWASVTMGWFGWIVFAVVFIVGAILWASGRIMGQVSTTRDIYQEMKEEKRMWNEIKSLDREILTAINEKNENKVRELKDKQDKLRLLLEERKKAREAAM
jgi:Sec-independent protein translocase protein TatA